MKLDPEDEERYFLAEVDAYLREEQRRVKITSWLLIAFGIIVILGKIATRDTSSS